MPRRFRTGVALVSLYVFPALWVPIEAGNGQDGPLEAVLRRASVYVEAYRRQLGSVIADEHYVQHTNEPDPSTFTAWAARRQQAPLLSFRSRTLASELLLFTQAGEGQPWIAFRDVVEVDGQPAEDRAQRLVDLVREDPTIDLDLWQRLAAESARFNIGSVQRDVNVPTMALQLLTSEDRRRVRFERGGQDSVEGVATWKLRFRETAPPALVRGADGQDLFSEGTFWIDPATGHVWRSELETKDAASHIEMQVRVDYVHDARLGILVPARMRERYRRRIDPAGNTRSRILNFELREVWIEIDCEATYSNFRRFEVNVTFRVPGDPGR